ncbi:MAG: adenylyl-sulfate kinase [Planctomycetes bacterium]|nr:adenylyl-sulfate kinase [Planctomycetota bacterium]
MSSVVTKKYNINNEPQRHERQKMNIVIIGHVDHGKSTLVGRLLADTHSLPEGKLEEVKLRCAKNARPFEYAFLLDALKDEQAQGITIDSARCFFHSDKREYILIDAPGHIEFLKNMISGAARAEAAVLVIDAHEGIQENSRRHGYLLSMLGIRQIVVAVNKMDLVDYSRDVFDAVQKEFAAFLSQIQVTAQHFIPVSAREGDFISQRSSIMDWFEGPTILEALDQFEKEPASVHQPLRFPVQDIYKFTAQDDDRRIVAGQIETGQVRVGDEVVFYPSKKRSKVLSVEAFNVPTPQKAYAGQSVGVTLSEQIYVQPGEIMFRADETPPQTSTQLKINLFWLGKEPMIFNKRYLLKLGTARVPVWLRQINTVLDASDLNTEMNRRHIERHDVAECVLETLKPVAFDLTTEIAQTSRFVLIDNYHIAGGGVILDVARDQLDLTAEHVRQREKNWRRSRITACMRQTRINQQATLVVVSGPAKTGKSQVAQMLEEKLFDAGKQVYYLGIENSLPGIDRDLSHENLRDEYIHRLGETAHLFTDAGLILIATVSDLAEYELSILKTLNQPGDTVVVGIGSKTLSDSLLDLQLDETMSTEKAATTIANLLTERHYLPEYYL